MKPYIISEITKVFPKVSNSLSKTLWCVFTGKYPQGVYRNVTLPNGELVQGSWNYWAEIIMKIKCKKKEKPSDYFKSNIPTAKMKTIEKKLKKAGWKFADEGIRLDANEKLQAETLKLIEGKQK
jgi:hypothetical protein